MGWKIFDEDVDMVARRFQYFPSVFRWRGRRIHAQVIQRTWISWGKLQRRPARRFFIVRCREGAFELFQDLESGHWHLRRAKLTSAKRVPVRTMAPALR